MEECPVCGSTEYQEFEGMYEGSMKLIPDMGKCGFCEFCYQEHIDHPRHEQVDRHKKYLARVKISNRNGG